MGYFLGTDVGGTFTDLWVSASDGRTRVFKSPTTKDVLGGVLDAIRLMRQSGNERVHIEWKTATAFDTREARLLDRAGNPLPVQVTLGEKPGVLAADCNLAPLAAGDYILDLTVTSGVVTAKTKISFRIVN